MYKIKTKLEEREIIECLNHIGKYNIKYRTLTDSGIQYQIEKDSIESAYLFMKNNEDELLDLSFADISQEDFKLIEQAIISEEEKNYKKENK